MYYPFENRTTPQGEVQQNFTREDAITEDELGNISQTNNATELIFVLIFEHMREKHLENQKQKP